VKPTSCPPASDPPPVLGGCERPAGGSCSPEAGAIDARRRSAAARDHIDREEARIGIVELFAGLGCVARAFERTGRFETILLTDVDPAACDTYRDNFPSGARYLREDIRRLHKQDVLDAVDGRTVDGLLGCPPCQGFSAAGRRSPSDKRNELLGHFFALVHDLRPKFFLMENVPRVFDFSLLRQELADVRADYRVWTGVLNAALFGLPQTRQRAIVIGYRRDLGVHPSGPIPTHFGARPVFDYNKQRLRRPTRFSGPSLMGLYPGLGRPEEFTDEQVRLLVAPGPGLRDLVVVGEAIDDLPPAGASDDAVGYASPPSAYAAALRASEVHNHRRWRHREDMLERLRGVPEGAGLLDGEGRSRSRRYFSQAYARLHRDGLARTVTTNFHNPGSGRFLHYRQLRTITVREAARLQGIEDGFVFVGHQSVQERLVGNAFPMLLAEALARHIASELSGIL
jgi:DNA (cytosine-5)-methyltransferase 1